MANHLIPNALLRPHGTNNPYNTLLGESAVYNNPLGMYNTQGVHASPPSCDARSSVSPSVAARWAGLHPPSEPNSSFLNVGSEKLGRRVDLSRPRWGNAAPEFSLIVKNPRRVVVFLLISLLVFCGVFPCLGGVCPLAGPNRARASQTPLTALNVLWCGLRLVQR